MPCALSHARIATSALSVTAQMRTSAGAKGITAAGADAQDGRLEIKPLRPAFGELTLQILLPRVDLQSWIMPPSITSSVPPTTNADSLEAR